MSKKLHEGNIAEIKELFGGTYKDVRELAKIFKVHPTYITWIVDYKGRRGRLREAAKRRYNKLKINKKI